MTKIVHALYVCLLASNFSHAQTKLTTSTPQSEPGAREIRGASADSAANLPVRRVVLYKNGVGYFEHLGRVRGNQTVHVDFTSAQLNDVLKSLAALDLSGGHIAGVDYNSEAPPRSPASHASPRSWRKAQHGRFSGRSPRRARGSAPRYWTSSRRKIAERRKKNAHGPELDGRNRRNFFDHRLRRGTQHRFEPGH